MVLWFFCSNSVTLEAILTVLVLPLLYQGLFKIRGRLLPLSSPVMCCVCLVHVLVVICILKLRAALVWLLLMWRFLSIFIDSF